MLLFRGSFLPLVLLAACRSTPIARHPTAIAVRDGKVVSFENALQPVRISQRDLPRPTIDSLFAWVRDAYTRKAAIVRVTYDPEFHFPTNAFIDWDLNVIDD